MSHSKYEYVRKFETEDRLLPECWIVVRIDGKAFHKFSDKHNFVKPNDKPALDLVLLESYTLNKELMFLCCFLGSRIQLRI
jgi:tRNA(His) guanylyltransferase